MYLLTVTGSFSSAHALRDYGGPCERLHGHNWRVEVTVSAGELDDRGLAIDFRVLRDHLGEICDRLDHRLLNELEPFDRLNPTSENLARYLAGDMESRLRGAEPPVRVREVRVWESEGSSAAWRNGEAE
jgi:6-pyruvoyltetrahydropterin/6-carboxytetrahydropterin synthase